MLLCTVSRKFICNCWRNLRVLQSSKNHSIALKNENNIQNTKLSSSEPFVLHEFFDDPENFGKTELRPLNRPGRAWTLDEIRLKSNSDLHKLWFVLIKERNMLLTMEHAYRCRARFFPNPERLDRVKESMDNIEAVIHERNDAFIELETGDRASPPMKTITSFMGFVYKQQAKEHYLPAEETGEKEYEVPYLDADAHLMQRLWKEKEHLKRQVADYDAYFNAMTAEDDKRWMFGRGNRRHYDREEDLPREVLAKNSNDGI